MPAAHLIARGKQLPAEVQRELRQIRDSQLRAINEAIGDYSIPVQRDAGRLIRRIRALHDNPQEIRRLLAAFHVKHTQTRIGRIVLEQIADASGFARRYERLIGAFHAARVGPAATGFGNVSSARAAIALRNVLTLRRPEAASITAGDRLARRVLKQPPAVLVRGTPLAPVSSRLHGQAIATSRDATRVVLRSIREQQSLGFASRELTRQLSARGLDVAGNAELPELVRRLQASGRALARGAGDPKEWNRLKRQIDRHQRTLLQSGRVQGAYLELLQDLQKWGPAQVDRAVERWTAGKARFHAEQWIRTETAAAYRAAQMKSDEARPWIIGYRWRLNRGVHQKAVNRRFGTTGKGKNRRSKRRGRVYCVCEIMDGSILSPAVAKDYPRGGHPHCTCLFEPVYNDRALLATPATAQEIRDLDL